MTKINSKVYLFMALILCSVLVLSMGIYALKRSMDIKMQVPVHPSARIELYMKKPADTGFTRIFSNVENHDYLLDGITLDNSTCSLIMSEAITGGVGTTLQFEIRNFTTNSITVQDGGNLENALGIDAYTSTYDNTNNVLTITTTSGNLSLVIMQAHKVIQDFTNVEFDTSFLTNSVIATQQGYYTPVNSIFVAKLNATSGSVQNSTAVTELTINNVDKTSNISSWYTNNTLTIPASEVKGIIELTSTADLDYWQGGVSTSLSGAGTEADPYKIYTPNDMKYFITTGSDTACYELMNDIYLSKYSFEYNDASGLVIATNMLTGNTAFYIGSGAFGTTVNTTTASTAGQIYYTTATPADLTITNLTTGSYSYATHSILKSDSSVLLNDVYRWDCKAAFNGDFDGNNYYLKNNFTYNVTETYFANTFCGDLHGALLDLNTLNGLSLGAWTGGSGATGFVSWLYDNGIINNCINYNCCIGININDNNGVVTGIASGCRGNVINCINYGTMIQNYYDREVSGVVGTPVVNGKLVNCFNSGKIIGVSSRKCGGIVNMVFYDGGTCSNSYNTGIVKSYSGVYTGAIIGNKGNTLASVNNHYISNSAFIGTTAQLGVGGDTSSNSTDTGCISYTNISPEKTPNCSDEDKQRICESLNQYVAQNPSVIVNGKTYMLNSWKIDKNQNNGFPIMVETEVWDGITPSITGKSVTEIASMFAGGDGSAENPFLISNGNQLALLRPITLSADASVQAVFNSYSTHYKLTNNIFLNDEVFPTDGTAPTANENGLNIFFEISTSCFVIDGNNYIISGFYQPSAGRGGLFRLHYSSIIKNFHLKNGYVTGNYYPGGIASHLWEGAVMSNCSSNITVIALSGAIGQTGGLVGVFNEGGYMQNCYCTGYVKSNNGSNIGGLVGYMQDGGVVSKTSNSYFAGTLGSSGGAIFGNYEIGTFENVYYKSGTYAVANSKTGITALDNANMQATTKQETLSKLANFAGFDPVWTIDIGLNNGYPTLKPIHT